MPARQENGIMIGLVTDLKDPENLGRVRVKFPQLGDQLSDWARLAAPMAGKDRGLFMRPEVDDEVLVAFEHGDPRRPYVIGALWSKADPPPADDGKPQENNWRFIKSRSGHIIKLNDTKGQETIEVIDKTGSRKVIIDSANKKIQVTADDGDIEVKAGGGNIKIEAASNVEIKASGNMNLEASGTMTIKGATVNIN
jgi:phage baseplate assembly protein V